MSEHVEIDLELVEELTKRETAALDRKHRRSLEYREAARTHLPGGVSSSWQSWPPHPIYVSRGAGSRVWDIDGNEYVDYHNGYGVMVMGHAHPRIVEAVQRRVELGTHFAQPTEDALACAENLAERFGLPLWRFGNSGTEATLDATRIMRAVDRPDEAPEDRGHATTATTTRSWSASSRRRRRPGRAITPTPSRRRRGMPEGIVEQVVNVPFNDAAAARRAFEEHPGEIAGMIVEPAMTNCGLVLPDPGYLRRAEGDLPRERRAARVRRGEDRLHARVGRRGRGVRRRSRSRLPREGDRRRPAVRRDRRDRRRRWA